MKKYFLNAIILIGIILYTLSVANAEIFFDDQIPVISDNSYDSN
jgi:hypothetical protein